VSNVETRGVEQDDRSVKSAEERQRRKRAEPEGISFFEKYLTIWVLLCMAGGILIGRFLPGIPRSLEKIQVADQNFPSPCSFGS